MSVSVNAPVLTGSGVPIGSIVMWWSNSLPAGWLLCDGKTIQKSTYPELVKVIAGNDTATSAVLPDFRGVSPAGAGRSPDRGNSKNIKGGESVVIRNVYGGNNYVLDKTLSISIPVPPHKHSITIPMRGAVDAHDTNDQPLNWDYVSAGPNAGLFGFTGKNGNYTKATISTAGTSNQTSVSFSHDISIVHPVLGVNFIIKAVD